jgi:alcohol dehydrogenase class IV
MFGVMRSPRTILFGAGQRRALGPVVRSFGSRVFICSDQRIDSDPLLAELVDQLQGAGLVVEAFKGVQPELPLSCVVEAEVLARQFAPDAIVGLGGGSCLDTAKLLALSLAYPGPLSDYYGEFKVPGATLPVIALPTTAGTGSEVTPVAVLGDPARQMKIGISSPHLIPRVAICDPELTLSCPPGLTAIAGADALTHAIEAFMAARRPPSYALALEHVFVGKNRLSDGFARQAIAALAANLKRAVEDGADLEAREEVMFGALAAALAFGVAGTAAAHAIQYPVGALTHTAHGIGVAALMPYVMEFNRSAVQAEAAEIAHIFDRTGSEEDLAAAASGAVADLLMAIGIPSNLAALGLTEDHQDWVAEQALLATRLIKNNPRPLDRRGVSAIVAAALHGDLHQLKSYDS